MFGGEDGPYTRIRRSAQHLDCAPAIATQACLVSDNADPSADEGCKFACLENINSGNDLTSELKG